MAGDKIPESYVRVASKVEPTDHVVKFRERLADMGLEHLPPRGKVVLPTARTREERIRQGAEPEVREVPISAATIYPAEDLRVTIYERHFPNDTRAQAMHLRLLGLLVALDLEHLDEESSPSKLMITSSRLIETTDRIRRPHLREFSLAIDEGESHVRLVHRYDRVHEYVSKVLKQPIEQVIAYDPWASPDIVPVLTVSRYTDRRSVDAFVERANSEALGEPLVTFNVLPPKRVSTI